MQLVIVLRCRYNVDTWFLYKFAYENYTCTNQWLEDDTTNNILIICIISFTRHMCKFKLSAPFSFFFQETIGKRHF